jgi:SAM-dependent methyltransferase
MDYRNMNTDRINELRKEWEAEEKIAHIHGWDFSHIHDRYEEEDDLPWDYKKIIEEYLDPDMKLMDFDTGGGEFLLSLGHPYKNTAATEGFPPNVELCKETLLPLGIDFKPCDNESDIPFADSSFDIMINRHGSFAPKEIHRLLKEDGIFITQQVGGKNDRELVEMVLPGTPEPFPELELSIQKKKFEEAGFEVIRGEEVFRPIRFYDVGAFVWFARIIEWEFPGFSVEKCFDKLLEMQEEIDKNGFVQGTIHRYLIVAKK